MSPHESPCRNRACPRCTRVDNLVWGTTTVGEGQWVTTYLDPTRAETPITPDQRCELYSGVAGRECGSTDRVRRFLFGWRCAPHAPDQPDPAGTAPEPVPSDNSIEYGTATDDPLGRTIPGNSKTYIPRRPTQETPT